jgi:hypothetical protein
MQTHENQERFYKNLNPVLLLMLFGYVAAGTEHEKKKEILLNSEGMTSVEQQQFLQGAYTVSPNTVKLPHPKTQELMESLLPPDGGDKRYSRELLPILREIDERCNSLHQWTPELGYSSLWMRYVDKGNLLNAAKLAKELWRHLERVFIGLDQL